MATNPTLLGRLLVGRYRLRQRRGTGAHGIVLDAIDEQQDRQVAIKILRPQFVATGAAEARFRLEAQTAASMSHPNLNAVYDWGVEEIEGAKVPFLVLEYLPGGSLRDMLDRGRLLSPSQALTVGLDVCRGLDFMHRHGVIHRDLKPASLAFGDDRHVRILDVGLSRLVAEQTWVEPTAAGIDAARYASPEQARGGRPEDGTLGSATDVYTLALILIEAVTGQVPFSSDSTVATLNARMDKLMPVSADFGPLASVLSRAGSSDPEARYTAAEFGQALVQAAEKLPRPTPLDIVGTGTLADAPFGENPPPPASHPAPAPGAPSDALQSSAQLEPPTEVEATEVESTELESTSVGSTDAAATPSVASETVSASEMVSEDVAGGPQTLPSPSGFEQDVFVSRSTLPPVLSPDRVPFARPDAATLAGSVAAPHETDLAEPPLAALVGGIVEFGPASPSGIATAIPGSDRAAVPAKAAVIFDDADRRSRSSRRLGWILAAVIAVAALAVGAFVVFGSATEKSFVVPDLSGVSQAVAQNQIAQNGWNLLISTERSDVQSADNVIRTDPPAGTKLKKGASITFVVSAGPTLSTIPEIAGQTLDAATVLLTQNKLGIAVGSQVYSETVPSGTIISWSIPAQPGLAAGAQVMPNSVVVSAVVSQGPAPRSVPNLLGMDVATATATLAALQLTIVQDPADQFSSTYPVGAIAVQSLPAGTAIQRGQSVTVALSKGPDLVAIPALAGLTFDQISAALTGVGLRVGKVTGDKVNGMISDATVAGVSAVPGQTYLRNTKIDLVFTTPPPPTEAPTSTVAAPTSSSVG